MQGMIDKFGMVHRVNFDSRRSKKNLKSSSGILIQRWRKWNIYIIIYTAFYMLLYKTIVCSINLLLFLSCCCYYIIGAPHFVALTRGAQRSELIKRETLEILWSYFCVENTNFYVDTVLITRKMSQYNRLNCVDSLKHTEDTFLLANIYL